jgi:tellurite resistance protein
MDSLLIVRLWAAAAWADGKMHPAEAAALRRLIEASEDLDGPRRAEALALLDRADVHPEEIKQLPLEAREGVYRAALAIVRLDGVVTDDERAFIARLRAATCLDESTLSDIEAEPR